MTVNPLETSGLSRILHIFAASMPKLQILLLILENSPFPWYFLEENYLGN